MTALAVIRAANRHIDWVVWMRLSTGAAVVGLALAGLGLSPLGFVLLIALLFVAEATIELTRAPPALRTHPNVT